MPKKSIQDKFDPEVSTPYRKLVIFSMGGKGGVGKTTLMTSVVEYFVAKRKPILVLDLDAENKSKGGLNFAVKYATKVNVQKPDGLDAFISVLDREENVVVADMGAGQGDVAAHWFDDIYKEVHESGVGFLAIGLVTPDPASVASVLQWANSLQERVQYLIVLNEGSDPGATFSYWHESAKAKEFCDRFQPAVMTMQSRSSELQGHITNYGLTLSQVAERQTGVEELNKSVYVLKAQRYRRVLFEEFCNVIDPFLPEG